MLQRRFDTTLDLRKKDSCASTAQICKCNGPPNCGIAPSSSAPDDINRCHEINCCIGVRVRRRVSLRRAVPSPVTFRTPHYRGETTLTSMDVGTGICLRD